MTVLGSATNVFVSFLGVPSLGMHLAMSVALQFFEGAGADLDCRPRQPFGGDFRGSTLPFDRVLTQIQTAATNLDERAIAPVGVHRANGRCIDHYRMIPSLRRTVIGASRSFPCVAVKVA
jgi:hypothetical protein